MGKLPRVIQTQYFFQRIIPNYFLFKASSWFELSNIFLFLLNVFIMQEDSVRLRYLPWWLAIERCENIRSWSEEVRFWSNNEMMTRLTSLKMSKFWGGKSSDGWAFCQTVTISFTKSGRAYCFRIVSINSKSSLLTKSNMLPVSSNAFRQKSDCRFILYLTYEYNPFLASSLKNCVGI